ncbi:MAG TPA: phosphotransferase, partial [Lacipirellulaceae bacterium]|nr:phosphotransferase [Lacipirellulaceae bacterium]
EGVNVAARLQALTEPGGILIAGAAYDYVRNKVNAAWEDLGPQSLKNLHQTFCGARARPSRRAPNMPEKCLQSRVMAEYLLGRYREVLNLWPALIDLHSELRNGASPLPQQLIHGDANNSNVYLHKTLPSRLVLVDWEWAGFGDPFLDLASLLKGVDATTERRCRRLFAGSSSDIPRRNALDGPDGVALYLLNQLERGILDASYLSAHLSGSTHNTKFDVSRAIMNSLGRVQDAFRRLSRDSDRPASRAAVAAAMTLPLPTRISLASPEGYPWDPDGSN